MSIPTNSLDSSDYEPNLVGFTGPLRSERRDSVIQMSGPIYSNRNQEFIFQPPQKTVEPKVERYPSSIDRTKNNNWAVDDYMGKNEHLLRSGQLGMCNDPYCTTCPMYYSVKGRQKPSRTSIADAQGPLRLAPVVPPHPTPRSADASTRSQADRSSKAHHSDAPRRYPTATRQSVNRHQRRPIARTTHITTQPHHYTLRSLPGVASLSFQIHALDEKQNEVITSASNELAQRKADLEVNLNLLNELKAPALAFDANNFSLWGSGEWWMLLAAQSMAIGTVMVRWVSKYSDPVMATGWHMVIGGLPLMAISILNHDPALSSFNELTTSDVVTLLYTSIFGSAISYGVFFYNATRGSLTKLSSHTFFTPMFASVFGPLQLVGALITVATIYMVNYKTETRMKEDCWDGSSELVNNLFSV